MTLDSAWSRGGRHFPDASKIDTGAARIFARRAGNGPGLLLLHGFPQTHLMWRDVAPSLARDFTVVCADLRDYGGKAPVRLRPPIMRPMPSASWPPTLWC